MTGYVITDRRRQRWIIALTAIAAFMTCLDNSMFSAALPTISSDVDIGVDAIAILPAVNLLIFAGLVLSFGRLGDLRGYSRVFATGAALYGAGLLICGLSPGLCALVGGRLVQSLGATMAGPTAGAMNAFFMPARPPEGPWAT